MALWGREGSFLFAAGRVQTEGEKTSVQLVCQVGGKQAAFLWILFWQLEIVATRVCLECSGFTYQKTVKTAQSFFDLRTFLSMVEHQIECGDKVSFVKSCFIFELCLACLVIVGNHLLYYMLIAKLICLGSGFKLVASALLLICFVNCSDICYKVYFDKNIPYSFFLFFTS